MIQGFTHRDYLRKEAVETSLAKDVKAIIYFLQA